MELKYMTFDEWSERFKPITNHLDSNASFSGMMFETFGGELDFVKSADPGVVWTYQNGESDDQLLAKLGGYTDEDGCAVVDRNGEPFFVDFDFIGDGYHVVNRIGYFVTELPAEEGVQYIIYTDDDVAKAAQREIKRPQSLEEWKGMSLDQYVYFPENGDSVLTKGYFLELCNGNHLHAYELLSCCEWQHPETVLDEGGGLEEMFDQKSEGWYVISSYDQSTLAGPFADEADAQSAIDELSELAGGVTYHHQKEGV